MVKKYMHENLRHISTKTFGQKKKYAHYQTITTNNSKHVSDFMSNNTDTLMELLSNNTTHFSRHQTMLNNQTKSFSSTLPWKIRIQRQTTSKLLWQGTKSEKWQKVQLESFFCLRFKSIIFYIYRELSSLT